jgi:hypothetical protein
MSPTKYRNTTTNLAMQQSYLSDLDNVKYSTDIRCRSQKTEYHMRETQETGPILGFN